VEHHSQPYQLQQTKNCNLKYDICILETHRTISEINAMEIKKLLEKFRGVHNSIKYKKRFRNI